MAVLALSGTMELGNAADRLEGAHVGVDPSRAAPPIHVLAKVKLDAPSIPATKICAGARIAPLLEPIDDDRDAVAGVVDEQPLAGGVRLAYRHRQRLLEGSIKLAEPRVAVAARIRGDVFVPRGTTG